MKAWAARQRFQAGTNMRAWTFIILRNLYLSQMRRARFKGEWDDLVADRILAAPASQDRHVELADMQRALLHLPQPQREALILVGAGGFAYEEAAEICGVAVGTIKSRVARGRVALEALMNGGDLPSRARQRERRPQRTRRDHGRSGRAQPRLTNCGSVGRQAVSACSIRQLRACRRAAAAGQPFRPEFPDPAHRRPAARTRWDRWRVALRPNSRYRGFHWSVEVRGCSWGEERFISQFVA